MIRMLAPDDFEPTISLFESVVDSLRGAGIDQWDEIYPSADVLSQDIARGHAFGCTLEGILAGYVAVNDEADPAYDLVTWQYDLSPSIYVHRLAVGSRFRGKGVAKRLMAEIEEHARGKEYKTIRLDAFAQNPAAISLYEGLGYRKAGTITLRKGEFFVYEKML